MLNISMALHFEYRKCSWVIQNGVFYMQSVSVVYCLILSNHPHCTNWLHYIYICICMYIYMPHVGIFISNQTKAQTFYWIKQVTSEHIIIMQFHLRICICAQINTICNTAWEIHMFNTLRPRYNCILGRLAKIVQYDKNRVWVPRLIIAVALDQFSAYRVDLTLWW